MVVWWIVAVVVGISYVYMFVGGTTLEAVLPRSRRFDPSIKCDDKLVVVTGANKGIGFGTALAFARRGAEVILACRNDERAKAAVDAIIKETGNARISSMRLDLSSFESVRQFVAGLAKLDRPVDILVNNAGAMFDNYLTSDGYNMTVQSNFLSHALLTFEVLLRGLTSSDARILQVSSVQHNKGVLEIDNLDGSKSFGKLQFYNNTKLMQVLFAKKLASSLSTSCLRRSFSVHPGVVKTDFIIGFVPKGLSFIGEWIIDKLLLGPEDGAQSILYAALAPKLAAGTGADTNGAYIDNCEVTQASTSARSPQLQDELWEYLLELFSIDAGDIKNLKVQARHE